MAKTKSFGTTISVGGSAVGGVTSITRSGADRNFIDATNHSSTDGYREFLPGLKDGGTCEISGHYDAADAGQDLLRTAADTIRAVVITLPNSVTIGFNAYVQPPDEDIPLDDMVTFTASLKVTGAITYS